MQKDIVWTTHEHTHTEKGSDWFWAVGIVAISSAIVAILFQNFLFALLIIVGSGTLALLSTRPEHELQLALTPQGILINEALYPYKTLVAYWIADRDTDHAKLIIDARQIMTPHIIVSLAGVDAENVHSYLSEFLPEKELEEPFFQHIFERLGF